MNHTALKQFLLLENTWIHISSILDIELPLFLQNIHLFKLLFLNKRLLQPKHIEEEVHNKDVFYAFLNQEKEFNLALENPKYSPNALQELERYIHNVEVEDIERIVITQENPHHWLQTDIIRIQIFLYHYFKDITLNEQSIPIKLISLFLRKFFRFNYQIIWSEQDQAAFTAFTTHFTTDECLPFIINERNEHLYFFKPEKLQNKLLI